MKMRSCFELSNGVQMPKIGFGTYKSTDGSEEVIQVATGQSMAPFCYLDADGNLVGYDIDVLHSIDEYLDEYTFNISAMDFSTCVVSIDSGAADIVSHQLGKSEERKDCCWC